jgi:hypothetical protein
MSYNQVLDKNTIYGNWFTNCKLNSDTLLFVRHGVENGIYSRWFFNTNVITINSGKLENFSMDRKINIASQPIRYNWTFDNEKNTIGITNGEKINRYTIHLVNEKSMILINDLHNEINFETYKDKIIYYYTAQNFDSSYFSRNSITFSLKDIDPDFPRLELLNDSSFKMTYNIHSYDVQIEPGIMQTFFKSEIVEGIWEGKVEDEIDYLFLTLRNNEIIKYKLIQKNDLLYFEKKE